MVSVADGIQRYLSTVMPFRMLSEKALKRLSAQAQMLSYERGQTVYSEGETADSVWVLREGRLQVFKYTSQGKPLAVESLTPGELFGVLCRLGTKERIYPCTAVASKDVSAVKISEDAFYECYEHNASFVQSVCSICSVRLKDIQDLRCLGQESVAVRVAAFLHRLRRSHGDVLPFTKREISELAGTTIETTFRTFAEFQKKGILQSSRGRIHLRKPEALKSYTQKP